MEKAEFIHHLNQIPKGQENPIKRDRLEGKALKGEVSLQGQVDLPIELCNQIHQLQLNQNRIATRLDLLFGILKRMGMEEKDKGVEENFLEDLSRIHWGKSEEEQKLTLFQIFKEVEDQGKALRTTELKEMGGKFSTAVSYSYKIFGGWKQALRNYRDYRSMDKDFNVMGKKG